MESLDLTYKLIAFKIKSKTLDQIYFMSQVFQEHSHYYDKRKNKKMKTTKMSLGGGVATTPPPPPGRAD